MIYDKIIPSCYFIEMAGDVCEVFVNKKFKIERITVTSNDFDSDIAAIDHVSKIINFATENYTIEKEDVGFNPEFFPSIPSIKSEMKDDEAEPESISTNFDIFGDFVQIRSKMSGEDFSITSRIIANPDIYSAKKAVDHALKNVAMVSDHREITPQINIH